MALIGMYYSLVLRELNIITTIKCDYFSWGLEHSRVQRRTTYDKHTCAASIDVHYYSERKKMYLIRHIFYFGFSPWISNEIH